MLEYFSDSILNVCGRAKNKYSGGIQNIKDRVHSLLYTVKEPLLANANSSSYMSQHCYSVTHKLAPAGPALDHCV